MADQADKKTENKPLYKGRIVISTDYAEVTPDNIVEILNESLPCHASNVAQINYLWNYYKGQQPILQRVKEVRPEICNKIVENHAQEIVAFKIGYQLAEPLQYTCRSFETEDAEETQRDLRAPEPSPGLPAGGGANFSLDTGDDDKDSEYQKRLKDVNELNTLMFAEDKTSSDRDLFEWMCVCGIGYRMAEADKAEDAEEGGAPFEIYTLDPRNTFVVYSRNYKHSPLMAVWTAIDPNDDTPIYNVWTEDSFYLIKNNEITKKENHSYGSIPIVEYRLNNALMGVFEPVLPLLDAINNLESNRLDGIEQTVQSLLKFINCDVTSEGVTEMMKLGAVKVTTTTEGLPADVDTINVNLDQTSSQVTKDDLYAAVINICGMPNRNGQSGSTSDTGAAVLLRDGWTLAESHAKGYELQFKRAERDFLRVILKICDQSKDTDIDLRVRDIELAFNRRNYENILVKSQVLTTMLSQNKIHPQLAFQSCGLFTDPDAAYLMSKKHAEENREEFLENTPFAPNQYTGQTTKLGSQANVPGPDNGDTEAEQKPRER